MIDLHLVQGALEKVDGAFDLFAKGRASPFILSVNVRAQADGMRAVNDDVATALSGLADQIEAAGKDPKKAKEAIRQLHDRFRAWRRDTMSVLQAAAKEVAKTAASDGKAAREALLAEAKATTGAPAPAAKDAAAAKAAQAEIAALGGDPDEAPPEMSIEDIEKILSETRKKL